ncbi:MAG: flap endonuclease-1 [Thermoplasmataceae archaeon]|jgi:flap endonuclease-1
MGVDIGDIVSKKVIKVKDFSGSIVSVDAYNILYQFLSSIRQPDGTPLIDDSGNVTSHLSGVFYRTVALLENGIRPVYVFDGKPSPLKNRTLDERRMIREKNKIELEQAITEGNEERIRSLSSRINYITREMVEETKLLLSYMGLPVVQAISEGEAQASIMSRDGVVQGVVSQDFDCLLFGARKVLRNFTFNGRRKLPGRNIYVNVSPEVIDLQETLEMNKITREQLIDVGILVGTDFNLGLKRVGAKTALNLIRKYGNIKRVLQEKKTSIENLDAIKDLFLNPPASNDYKIAFREPDEKNIIDFLCNMHSFSPSRVEPYIHTIRETLKGRSQSNLDFF